MSASVVTSITSNALYSSFNKNNKDVQNSLMKVGTGYRVTSAKDDAASSAIASGLTSELGAFEKAHLNTSQAASLLKTMESGIEQVTSMVQRIEALTIQSQSAALSSKNIATLQSEVAGLLGQMDKVVSTTNFNGVALLNGSTATTAYNPFYSGSGSSSQTLPASNVFPAGLSYSFDNSVKPTAIEIKFTASSAGCRAGVFSMTNLESGASQELAVDSPLSGSNTFYFDQIGASVTLTNEFASESFAYGVNTATTPGTGQILANSSGDINCQGVLTTNNNIAITETKGMISDVASLTVGISGISAKSATFTLPAFVDASTGNTNGDFIANNVDLSTTGQKTILLSRERVINGEKFEDSIQMQLTVTTAFTAADVSSSSPSSITLSQLQNVVIADSQSVKGGELTFQVNTSAVGKDSDNQYSISLPSISADSLGIASIDLTNTSQTSTNLHKIRNALSNLDLQRANVGVAEGQIEILQHNLEVSMENTTAARSSLVDLDFAKGVLELTNSTVRMQASQQALQRANGMQSQLIQLMQG